MKGRMINMKGEKYAIKRISILIVSILLMEIIISVFGISISYADERDKLVYVKNGAYITNGSETCGYNSGFKYYYTIEQRVNIHAVVEKINDMYVALYKDKEDKDIVKIPSSMEVEVKSRMFDWLNNRYYTYANVDMPVKQIGQTGFEYYRQNEGFKLDFSDATNLTKIGSYGFSHSGVEGSLYIPNVIIEDGAFQGCKKLTSVELAKGITVIENNVFDGCSDLSRVSIPNTVKTISRRAFANCKSLKEITIPKEVETIESEAFIGCSNLKNVYIPEGTKVEANAFSSSTEVCYEDSIAPKITTEINNAKKQLKYSIESNTRRGLRYYSIKDPDGKIIAGVEYGTNPNNPKTVIKNATVRVTKNGKYTIFAMNQNNKSITKQITIKGLGSSSGGNGNTSSGSNISDNSNTGVKLSSQENYERYYKNNGAKSDLTNIDRR